MFRQIKRLSISALGLTLAATIAVPGAALAVGTLDQENAAASNSSIGVYPCDAQTFTAGLTGTLDRVSLSIAKSPDTPDTDALVVEIRDTTASGQPGTTLLASEVVSATEIEVGTPNWIDVDLDPPAPSVAGTVYAIALRWQQTEPGTTFFAWSVTESDQYPGGALFENATTCAGPYPTAVAGRDALFRTYVTQAEPPPDVQPRGDIGGPCADPAYYGIFDNTASSVALKFRFRWYTRLGRHTVRKTVPAGAIFRTWEHWVKPFTTIRVAYKNPTTGKWVTLASEESVKGNYPPCEYKRGFTYPDA